MQALGVELAGRVRGVGNGEIAFDGDLGKHIAAAEAKQARLLDQIDHFTGTPTPYRPEPVPAPSARSESFR
ncbi:hypothetical protein ACVOMV_32010 [Mesorhizobium atlanticum]